MAEIELTPRERQALKGRAHALHPVVLLGAQGLSEAVIREIDRALAAHELIKVRVPGDEREAREALFAAVANRLGAARVQAIGKLLVFYRPRPDEPAPAAERSDQPRARRPAGKAPPRGAQRGKPGRDDVRRSSARTTAPRRSRART
jgi:putative YhbY family RNA-binding protein